MKHVIIPFYFRLIDKKPELNQYVLIYLEDQCWEDPEDPDQKRFWKVAQVKWDKHEEQYKFVEFGPDEWNGHDVLFWAPLPTVSEIMKEATL